MTTILLASFVTIALAVVAMALGVFFGRKPLRGSCGGLGSGLCEACTEKCPRRHAGTRADSPREDDACSNR